MIYVTSRKVGKAQQANPVWAYFLSGGVKRWKSYPVSTQGRVAVLDKKTQMVVSVWEVELTSLVKLLLW